MFRFFFLLVNNDNTTEETVLIVILDICNDYGMHDLKYDSNVWRWGDKLQLVHRILELFTIGTEVIYDWENF